MRRIQSALEYTATEYLKTIGVTAPSEYRIEQFEKIYHRLFKIYPDLHFIYLWHKYGSDYAADILNCNMDVVRVEYLAQLEHERVELERTRHLESSTPFEGVAL
jgi:hypothetical protein